MLKFTAAVIWRLSTRNVLLRKYSSPSATVFKTEKLDGTRATDKINNETAPGDDKKSGLVAAAFAHINSPEDLEPSKKPSFKSVKVSKNQQLELQIQKADTVDSLLVTAENAVVSRRHALKIVSILSDWSNSNKAKLSDFEKDPRFLKLCRILARSVTTQALSSLTVADDLSTVLGITGDDEAARLISNLTLPQMVKVMKVLNQRGRRSTPLLRALAHNIVQQANPIDLKKSADLLFSMASLNFPDPVLLDRICSDVTAMLPQNENKPAVVNSIIVSLGLLKYRHESCLTALAKWLSDHKQFCRASDLSSAVITLATVNYAPPEAEPLFEAAVTLKEEDLVKPLAWLDLVYSLLILDKATQGHLESTLHHDFVEKLLYSGEISIPSRRKLMSIDGYISLAFPEYSGPRLHEDVSVGVPVVYTKEKCLYVQSVMDTFKSLVSSEKFIKRDCNSNMGFLYDCEFAINSNCHPIPLEKAVNNKSVYRIAVLSLDYHDVCRKSQVPLGAVELYTRLLQLQGYKVLQIPFTEFNPRDKLVVRVQYIEKRLKEIVAAASS